MAVLRLCKGGLNPADAAEMRVAEPASTFEALAEHAVEADVGDPASAEATAASSLTDFRDGGGTMAFIQWMSQGALYTGLAINQAHTRLYAANGAGTGSVDVFNSSFNPVNSAFTHLRLQTNRRPPPRPLQRTGHQQRSVCDLSRAGHAAQTTAA